MSDLVGDVSVEFGSDGVVGPAAGPDEQLQGSAVLSGLSGDGLGGLALESGEFAGQDGAGVYAVLGPGEVGQVAGNERLQASGAGADGVGGEFGVAEQRLGSGVVEQVHGRLHGDGVSLAEPTTID